MILYQYPPTPTISLTTGPIAFTLDGVSTDVTQDTVTPANNTALPSQMFIYKDGVQYPISIDTGTPANTIGVPVILTGAAGPINITAGDLNVQLTDLGANFDATRVGDGSGNYAGITANDEIKSHDADLLAALPASLGQQTNAASLAVSLSTEQEIILGSLDTQLASISGSSNQIALSVGAPNTGFANIPVNATYIAGTDGINLVPLSTDASGVLDVSIASFPLPSGAATEAKQDTGNTSLADIDTNTVNIPNVITTEGGAQPSHGVIVMGHTGAGVARHILVESNGRQVTHVTTSALPTGAATETTLAAILVDTTSLDGKDFATETTLAALSSKLPAVLGQTTMAASLAVTLASDQAAIPNAIIAGTITNAQVTVGLTAVRATVAGSAPNAARKRLSIKPSKNNTGAIYYGSSSVTTANGLEIIGPDRLDFTLDASDYYLISDTAAQVVEIIEVV